jgi:hypothetical protein
MTYFLIALVVILAIAYWNIRHEVAFLDRRSNGLFTRIREQRALIDELMAIIESERYNLARERGEPYGIVRTTDRNQPWTVAGLPDEHKQLFRHIRDEEWAEAHQLAYEIYRDNRDALGGFAALVDTIPVASHPADDGDSSLN